VLELTFKKLPMRVGLGWDQHRVCVGRRLILGGIEIESEFGLEGHSDADVLTHAIVDALLGALGLGTIGQHFPDTNPVFRDVSSLIFLQKAYELVRESGYTVVNIDTVIIAQAPKLSKHFRSMEARLAEVLGVDPGQVSVKASSPEGIGGLGHSEGIAAQAVVLLEKM